MNKINFNIFCHPANFVKCLTDLNQLNSVLNNFPNLTGKDLIKNNAKARPCSRRTHPTHQASSWSHRHSTCKESNQVTSTNGAVATSCLARLSLWQLSPLSACTFFGDGTFWAEMNTERKSPVSRSKHQRLLQYVMNLSMNQSIYMDFQNTAF